MSLSGFEEEIYETSEENDSQTDNATAEDRLIAEDDVFATSLNFSYQVCPIYLQFDNAFEIDPKKLTIYRENSLGHGFFSDVFKGKLVRANSIMEVAVKVPKCDCDPEMQQAQRNVLRDELFIMHSLQKSGGHDNVLKFVGAITTLRNEFCMLSEYCEFGSMDRFLQEKFRDGLFENELNFEKGDDTGSKRQTWKVLHRDVALRNVLLKSDFTLKVADFGLARRIFEGDEEYQVWKNHMALPFRYMAPETLVSLKFTIYSECWSFGVVVWELFTFAVHHPYFQEIGNVGNNNSLWRRLESFLKSGGRMSMPKEAPEELINLVLALWNEDPQQRPSFQSCKKLLRKELMQSCPRILENEQLIASQSEISLLQFDDFKYHWYQKFGRVGCIIFVIIVLSIFSAATFLILTSLISPREEINDIADNIGLKAARWSWSFNASILLNAKLNDPIYGLKGGLTLGSSSYCSLKWQPYFEKKGNEMIPFLLQYVEGPPNQRAWRSMLLLTGDGREVMVGNDFHRNRDGFIYNTLQFDAQTFALNLAQLSNSSENDILTLKIEVFVDPAKTDCKLIEKCGQLQTNTKLYFNGSCYVGSNTPVQFAFSSHYKSIQFCNDIPSAAISRLAWVESEELLNVLRDVMKIHRRNGERVNPPYYIGAKYFSENGDSSPINRWQWIDSDLQPRRSFPENVSILKKIMSQHKTNHDYAVIFKRQNMLIAVTALEWYHYLCEYRDQE